MLRRRWHRCCRRVLLVCNCLWGARGYVSGHFHGDGLVPCLADLCRTYHAKQNTSLLPHKLETPPICRRATSVLACTDGTHTCFIPWCVSRHSRYIRNRGVIYCPQNVYTIHGPRRWGLSGRRKHAASMPQAPLGRTFMFRRDFFPHKNPTRQSVESTKNLVSLNQSQSIIWMTVGCIHSWNTCCVDMMSPNGICCCILVIGDRCGLVFGILVVAPPFFCVY